MWSVISVQSPIIPRMSSAYSSCWNSIVLISLWVRSYNIMGKNKAVISINRVNTHLLQWTPTLISTLLPTDLTCSSEVLSVSCDCEKLSICSHSLSQQHISDLSCPTEVLSLTVGSNTNHSYCATKIHHRLAQNHALKNIIKTEEPISPPPQ